MIFIWIAKSIAVKYYNKKTTLGIFRNNKIYRMHGLKDLLILLPIYGTMARMPVRNWKG